MKNRLKELRTKKHLTLKELGEQLGMPNNTLSQYETGKREPKIETWEELASFFKVPPSYLMGLTNDKTGWLDWSRNTGYSISQLKNEVERLEKNGRLKNIDDIQEKINYAVESLDSDVPTTTQGIIHDLNDQLIALKQYVNNAFLDPDTIYLNEKHDDNTPFKRINPYPKVRDDMDKQAYEEILKILDNARYKIAQIKTNSK